MTQEDVIREYKKYESIRETARRLEISECVVRKCLIGAGILETPLTRKIAKLRGNGMQQKDIAELLNKSCACISANTPYERGMYIEPSQTINAQRIRECRRKQKNEQNKKSQPFG